MKILALDTASKTGWCVTLDKYIVESGVQDFTKRRGESNGVMFLRFRKWLSDIIGLIKPQIVIYEQAHFRGGPATEICVGLQTRVQEIAAEYSVECAPVKTTELKKYATGIGNADKKLMVTVATRILKRKPIDDNEADAVLLSMYGADNFK